MWHAQAREMWDAQASEIWDVQANARPSETVWDRLWEPRDLVYRKKKKVNMQNADSQEKEWNCHDLCWNPGAV